MKCINKKSTTLRKEDGIDWNKTHNNKMRRNVNNGKQARLNEN